MNVILNTCLIFFCSVAVHRVAVVDAEAKCTATQRSCKTVDQCIEKKQICDGNKDCPDDSDEARCIKRRVRCSSDQWRCTHDKKCIPATALCNGKDDCGDNSDESRCSKKNKNKVLVAEEQPVEENTKTE
ncbi:hypothetical protein Btru_038760 [Bulinus truncatus]|nr:hypothetical protein Btru_038760 [Bulinus truncatus]